MALIVNHHVYMICSEKEKTSFLANLVSLRKYFKQFENDEQNIQKYKFIPM